MNWWKSLKGRVKLKEPLKNYTTFKIGGRARYFIEPQDFTDLKLLLNFSKRYRIPVFVIGRGSNILVNDKGMDAIVLHLNSGPFKQISLSNNFLEAGSAVLLSQVINFTRKHNLSGAEFLSGIPGTVGGALVMNAGVKGRSISNLVEDVAVMDYNGKIKTLSKRDINFGYRRSDLSKYIVLSVRMKLKKTNEREINDRISRYLNYRKVTQDLSHPSAGCIFKNPKGISAGRLIDLCGLKGRRIGGAFVSLRHANFILNLKKASAKDVINLISFIKHEVRKKFLVDLKPEIKIWN